MNHETDTPRTDYLYLGRRIYSERISDLSHELERELSASKAEVERLKGLLNDLLILTEKNYWNSTNYKQIKEALNPTDK